MLTSHPLAGIYAAALTPLKNDFSVDPEAVIPFLSFLAARGCHGALLFGTTGEGPSFAPAERERLLRAALEIRRTHPSFRVLAGTGTPSLQETIDLTRSAFDLGCQGVLVLPPYYFRKADEQGLFQWFDLVIRAAVPAGGFLLGYHIPGQSGVALSLDLLSRLKEAHPQKFAGVKDSSGDSEHAQALGARFGDDFLVLTGNDGLVLHALEHRAGGAITAMSNLYSPILRRIWNSFSPGGESAAADVQAQLDARRRALDPYRPFAPILKALLFRLHGFGPWPLRPPLRSLPAEKVEACLRDLQQLENSSVR